LKDIEFPKETVMSLGGRSEKGRNRTFSKRRSGGGAKFCPHSTGMKQLFGEKSHLRRGYGKIVPQE